MSSASQETGALTPRQLEVLELAAKGLTNADIAELLAISPSTVKVHMAAVYRVLDVTNRTEAAMQLQALRAHEAPQRQAPGNAIAVLPFDALSREPEDEYFADGLVEELITRLSRWQWFPVIARQSCFTYKGRTQDIRQVGAELAAAYVVVGSIRTHREQIRVTAQLIDARNNAHLWAESFDGQRSDVFAIQDEIAGAVAAAIHPEMVRSELLLARRAHPRSVDAWQLAMGALALMETREREACERSLAMAQAALEQDPDCLIAAYTLALGHYQRLSFQWTTDPFASASALAEHAALCKRIAPDDPYSYIADGTACMLRADIDGAIAELTRAIERNPSAARAHSFLGQLRGMKGDPDGGIESLERAMLLSPRDTQLWSMLAAVGVCHFAADRLEQCSHYLHRAADRKGDEPLIWAILAAAAGLAGWQEEAELALAELFRVQPNFTLEGFRRVGAAILPAYLEKFEAGLRRAGYVDPA